jgi:hypothetical protein
MPFQYVGLAPVPAEFALPASVTGINASRVSRPYSMDISQGQQTLNGPSAAIDDAASRWAISSHEYQQHGDGEHSPKRNDDQPEDPIVPQDDV